MFICRYFLLHILLFPLIVTMLRGIVSFKHFFNAVALNAQLLVKILVAVRAYYSSNLISWRWNSVFYWFLIWFLIRFLLLLQIRMTDNYWMILVLASLALFLIRIEIVKFAWRTLYHSLIFDCIFSLLDRLNLLIVFVFFLHHFDSCIYRCTFSADISSKIFQINQIYFLAFFTLPMFSIS